MGREDGVASAAVLLALVVERVSRGMQEEGVARQWGDRDTGSRGREEGLEDVGRPGSGADDEVPAGDDGLGLGVQVLDLDAVESPCPWVGDDGRCLCGLVEFDATGHGGVHEESAEPERVSGVIVSQMRMTDDRTYRKIYPRQRNVGTG